MKGSWPIEENITEQERLSPSVLIVEDNPVNQKVAAGLFDKLGCHVHIAESGTQALLLVQEYDLDLIMMDWDLPGMDGFETAHAIRELEKTNRLERRGPLSKTRISIRLHALFAYSYCGDDGSWAFRTRPAPLDRCDG